MDWTPDRVRALRAALRLTHEEFAERVGVAPRTVRNWQAGKHAPTLALQRALDATAAAADRQDENGSGTVRGELDDVREALSVPTADAAAVIALESEVLGLHERFARVPPSVLLGTVRRHLRSAATLLREAHGVRTRARLVRGVGHLAGLRAWLAFDLGDEHSADDWYRVGTEAAAESEDPSLHGWLLGARSLLPSYRGDALSALAVVERAQLTAAGATPAVRVWLDALEARSCATLDLPDRALAALDRADGHRAATSPGQRLHGMDFHDGHLDLTYYTGTTTALLGRVGEAQLLLLRSLAVQKPEHRKARSIVLLSLAATHVQQREIDQACRVAAAALTIPVAERIGPITARWRDLRGQLAPWRMYKSVRELDNLAAG